MAKTKKPAVGMNKPDPLLVGPVGVKKPGISNPCKGSGKMPRANASRTHKPRNWGASYKCFYCKKYITTKIDGTLIKHRGLDEGQGAQKGATKKRKKLSTCAECRGPVYEVDYLCEHCRAAL